MKDFKLYVITGEEFHPDRDLVEVMEQAIQGGTDIIQLRDKTNSKKVVLEKALRLKELTQKYEVPFIVNDHIDRLTKIVNNFMKHRVSKIRFYKKSLSNNIKSKDLGLKHLIDN